MITGIVNSRCEGIIRLAVRNSVGQTEEVDAVLDTGFNGSLTLPSPIIAKLKLPWRSRGRATLANGSAVEFDVHAATVIWNRVPCKILVEAAETDPLIGTRLLKGFGLNMEMVPAGKVSIKPLRKRAR